MATPHVMQCMEIWGGNRPIAASVVMAGLDAWVYSKPYQSAGDDGGSGGDLHYLSSCATGRISRMIIADVSGHGAKVAAIAANLRRLMGKYSNYIDQTQLVEAVNRRFNELSGEGGEYTGLFATAVVATYFSPRDELAICNAGHPRPLRFDAAAGTWSSLVVDRESRGPGPRNLPLGVLDETRFDQATVTLGPRDVVLLYTDPLLEVKSPAGRLLGEAGLLDLLACCDAASPATLAEQIRMRLAAHALGRPIAAGEDVGFDDDLTMMVLRRNDQKPRPSPLLAIKAGSRLVGRAVSAVLGGKQPVALPQIRTDAILGAAFDRFSRRRR
jgi:serine phosphatase RsbU (regulator of sigma subunit)